MDDSVVVSDERLAVRKRPAALETDGLAGVELVVTALVDANVSFRVFDALPERVALEEVRLFREPEGGQWWRDAERHRLVFLGSVGPDEELIARWAVPSDVDESGGSLLRPPEIDSSTRTVEVGAHLDEISETIRRLESSFGRPPAGKHDDSGETGAPEAAAEAEDTDDGGSLVGDLIDEIESGRVTEPQIAALRDHLGAAGGRRPAPGDADDRSAAEEPVADRLLSILGDSESGSGDRDPPPEGTTNGEDARLADEPGGSAPASAVRSRLQRLERRVERLEAAIEEREAAHHRRAARIDALEDELAESVRSLREDLEDVRERRRLMADALRRPGETTATD